MTTETLDNVAADMVAENVPSLADFAEAPGGALPKGWYDAEIIEGYTTRKGKVMTTSDMASKNGDSRNARLCFSVRKPDGDFITMQEQFNYRTSDFSPERLAHVKALRVENKDVKGRWSDADAQRTSLAIAKIGAIEKAIGFSIRSTDGFVIPGKAVGQKLSVRLTINEDSFNEVSKFDKAAKTA